jgi:hypothetical protein
MAGPVDSESSPEVVPPFFQTEMVVAVLAEVTEGMRTLELPMDRRDIKLEENVSSTFFNFLSNIGGIKASKMCSMSQEATGLAPS